MKRILFLIFIFLNNFSFSQDFLYIDDKSYPSNGSFTFTINSDEFYNELNILVAKDGVKGILAFKIHSDFECVAGKVLMYLEDGSVITLIDRTINDNVDSESTTLYFLTPNEIERLKSSNILKIRFAFGPLKEYSGTNTNHTANNIYTYEGLDLDTFEKKLKEGTTDTTLYFSDFF